MGEREFAHLASEPDENVGVNLIATGIVTQFDAATGRCSFRASLAHDILDARWDYDVNAFVAAGDGETNCPVVDDVLPDDHLRMWLTTVGSMTYDNVMGGGNTAPVFLVHQVELLPEL